MRQYAKHRGVSDSAVRKAVKTGRITLDDDDKIDPNIADVDWEKNTQHQYKGANEVVSRGGVNYSAELQKAKVANESLKAQINKLQLEKMKNNLVDKGEACRLIFQLGRQERDAWINWPARISAQMASKLGIDEHTMYQTLVDAVRSHLQELSELKLEFNH